MQKPANKFLDDLLDETPIYETPIYEKETNISLSFALKQHTKALFLPPLELCRFSSNPVE